MASKLRSFVFAVTVLIIFFSVNMSFAANIQFTGKIKTATGQEYEGKITSISSPRDTNSIEVLYQGNLTFISIDKIKTIEVLDLEKKELAIEFKTGKKYIVNQSKSAPLLNIYIDQDIGTIQIDNANIKKITFYEILKTD